jgi:hypothetical protein
MGRPRGRELRLARPSTATTSLLELAAVAGPEFDLSAIARSGLIDEERSAAVREATTHGMIEEIPSPRLACRFTHELVRRAPYDRMPGLRRAELHLRVAEASRQRRSARLSCSQASPLLLDQRGRQSSREASSLSTVAPVAAGGCQARIAHDDPGRPHWPRRACARVLAVRPLGHRARWLQHQIVALQRLRQSHTVHAQSPLSSGHTFQPRSSPTSTYETLPRL